MIKNNIFELNRNEQKNFFLKQMKEAKDILNKKFDVFEDPFFILNNMKVYFFLNMNQKEKCEWIKLSLEYIKKSTPFMYELLEIMSVIYKFVNPSLRSKIFDCFFDIHENLLSCNRGVTTASIFIKNSHKAYNVEQKKRMQTVLDRMKKICTGKLSDTYDYTYKNYGKKFSINKNAQVLLLIPEFQTASSFLQPPLCMLNVCSLLKKLNIQVDFLDNRVFSYSLNQLLKIVSNYEYVALTSTPLDQVQTYFLDYRHTIFCNTVNFLKKHLGEHSKFIICGSHGSVRPDILKQTVNSDIILKGEYDFQLAYLLFDLVKKRDISNFPNIIVNNGTCWTEHPKNLSKQHPEEWCNSIIDYSFLLSEDYYGYQFIKNTHVKKKNWSVMQTTRGCPYNCSFCYNFYTKNVRFKNIKNLIIEMKSLQNMGVKELFFIDQTFTINKSYTTAFCKEIIKNNIKIKWTCETRIDLIDEELISIMKKSGCIAIWFGIESFDSDVLNLNNKGYNVEMIKENITLLNKYNVNYRAFIMIGMKGETKKSLENTIKKIIKNKIHLSKTIVYCQERFGTKIFDDLPEDIKNKINRFEILGLRKGKLSDNVDQSDINKSVKRLMLLANAK